MLEIEFETSDGCARLVDFMPPPVQALDVFRIAEGVRGRVPMRMDLRLRFDCGRVFPWACREDGDLVGVAGLPSSSRGRT